MDGKETTQIEAFLEVYAQKVYAMELIKKSCAMDIERFNRKYSDSRIAGISNVLERRGKELKNDLFIQTNKYL